MVATWSNNDLYSSESEQEMEINNNDPSSSEREQEIKIKGNLFLMGIDDEVFLDEQDDFDKLQNEYECVFNDFEKLKHR